MLSLIDSYEAMRHDRPYRPALSFEETIAELKSQAGANLTRKSQKVLLPFFTSCTKNSLKQLRKQNKAQRIRICAAKSSKTKTVLELF